VKIDNEVNKARGAGLKMLFCIGGGWCI